MIKKFTYTCIFNLIFFRGYTPDPMIKERGGEGEGEGKEGEGEGRG
jgi:hypothetical protein